MKNSLFLLFAFMFVAYGCSSSSESDSLMKDKTKIQELRPKGIIPTDHKSNEYMTKIGKYSLADVDHYYRKVLPLEKQQDYYNNVRKTLISSMVQVYGLIEKGNDKAIKYYLNELLNLKLMDPSITLRLLNRAEKNMNPEEVKSIARKIYDFNQKAIAGLDDPKSYLTDKWQKWEDIRVFSER